MENKFIFLSTCSTCKKIINVLGIENKSFLQDVKHKILSKNQLDFLYNYTKSYEALINKRGLVYKKLKQDGLIMNEKKFKELLEKASIVVLKGQYLSGTIKFILEIRSQQLK